MSVKTSGGVGVMGLAISRLLLARQASEAERQAVITGGLAIALAVMATRRHEEWRRTLRYGYASWIAQVSDGVNRVWMGPGFNEGFYNNPYRMHSFIYRDRMTDDVVSYLLGGSTLRSQPTQSGLIAA